MDKQETFDVNKFLEEFEIKKEQERSIDIELARKTFSKEENKQNSEK